MNQSGISIIQKAGLAVFKAVEALQKETKNQSELVTQAFSNDPHSAGNDKLVEQWKTYAKLSKTVSDMEGEFKKIYALVSGNSLIATAPAPVFIENKSTALGKVPGKRGRPKMAKPVQEVAVVKIPGKRGRPKMIRPEVLVTKVPGKRGPKPKNIDPIDLAVAKIKKAANVKIEATQKPSKKGTLKIKKPVTLKGNAAILMGYMEKILSTDEYRPISLTDISRKSEIPMGSISASMRKLTALRYLESDKSGMMRLKKSPASTATNSAPAPVVNTPPVVSKELIEFYQRKVNDEAAAIAEAAAKTPEATAVMTPTPSQVIPAVSAIQQAPVLEVVKNDSPAENAPTQMTILAA